MNYVVSDKASGPVFQLDDSPDYVRCFKPRNLHWGDPGTLETVKTIAAHFAPRGYLIEVGNITGPNRVNTYSQTHDGDNFDLAYPFADKGSGVHDMDGRSATPYRTRPDATRDDVDAIDYDRLHELLTVIVRQPLVISVLVGVNVHALLTERRRDAIPRVGPWKVHEDHLHVNMKHTRVP